MSSDASHHSQGMNNDDDAAFYHMVWVRVSHFNKYGVDSPEYVTNFDGQAPQHHTSPIADSVRQVDCIDPSLLYNNPPPTVDPNGIQLQLQSPGVAARSAQVSAADQIQEGTYLDHVPYNTPPTVDPNETQRRLPTPGVLTGSAQVSAADQIQEGTYLDHVLYNTPHPKEIQLRLPTPGVSAGPAQVSAADQIQEGTYLDHVLSVVDIDGGQYNPTPVGSTMDQGSMSSAAGVTPASVESAPQKNKSRKDSHVAEDKRRAPSNRRDRVRDSPTGHGIEYKDPRTGVWAPAVRHADIREALLQEADFAASLYGGYDIPPASGFDKTDRTAFVLRHKSWGPDRANRPEINFIFDKPVIPLPADVQPDTEPVDWVWRGFIVLDHNDQPMRYFDDCPTTLASCVEGFRLDAIMKRNPRLEVLDLWARLPPRHTVMRSDMSFRIATIVTISALNNVMMRWRYEACVLSFTRRWGFDDTKDFMAHFLTPEQLEANTTRGREDLTKTEVADLVEYKKAADAARREGKAPPTITRRSNHVAISPAVSAHSATTAQADGPVGPLISDAKEVKRVSNDSVELGRLQAAGVLSDHVDLHGQKRQFDEVNSGDLNNEQPEASQAAPEYRPVLPLKHTRRALPTSVDENPTTNDHSPDRQQYDQGEATALADSPSLGNIEGPPTKMRRSRAMTNVHAPQEQNTGLAQVRRPGMDISSVRSRSRSRSRSDKQRTLPNKTLSRGQKDDGIPHGQDPSPKNQKTVPAGYRHELYPIGLPVILFCPDDQVVRQGTIAKGGKTVWHEWNIPDTIQFLGAMDPSLELSHSVPGEIIKEVHTVSDKPVPTEPYTIEVPERKEPLYFPIGKKIVCVYPGLKRIVGGVIAADGPIPWQELSMASTILLLQKMDGRQAQ